MRAGRSRGVRHQYQDGAHRHDEAHPMRNERRTAKAACGRANTEFRRRARSSGAELVGGTQPSCQLIIDLFGALQFELIVVAVRRHLLNLRNPEHPG